MNRKDIFSFERHEDKVLETEAKVCFLAAFLIICCCFFSSLSPCSSAPGLRQGTCVAFISRQSLCVPNEKTFYIGPNRAQSKRPA